MTYRKTRLFLTMLTEAFEIVDKRKTQKANNRRGLSSKEPILSINWLVSKKTMDQKQLFNSYKNHGNEHCDA